MPDTVGEEPYPRNLNSQALLGKCPEPAERDIVRWETNSVRIWARKVSILTGVTSLLLGVGAAIFLYWFLADGHDWASPRRGLPVRSHSHRSLCFRRQPLYGSAGSSKIGVCLRWDPSGPRARSIRGDTTIHSMDRPARDVYQEADHVQHCGAEDQLR